MGQRGARTAGILSRVRRHASRSVGALALPLAFALAAPQASALTFAYNFTAGTSIEAQNGFRAAGSLWAALFSDPVTINLTVGTAALGSGIVGQAASRDLSYSYSAVRSALIADALSTSDGQAVASLPVGSVAMLINRTADNPNGSGSATPYLDNNGSANNTTMSLTAANARALGLTVPTGGIGSLCNPCDAFIQFSTNFAFDYNRADGITASTIDFVGVAAHEIGHALGFVSGVDVLDTNSPPSTAAFNADSFTDLTVLDLFRFSTASAAQNAVDFTASTTNKFFSLDRGATVGPSFSTGVVQGDGRQASHWKDNLGLGLMDPTVSFGTILDIAPNDALALDVVGWNLAAIPEAPSAAMFGAGLLALSLWRRRAAKAAARSAPGAGRTSPA